MASSQPTWRLLLGDVRAALGTLPEASVQCVVTSPPYWGLRDYGVAGQLGLEPTPAEYVAAMVEVFRAVRRVLRDDGTLWCNLGDSYANPGHYKGNPGDVGTIGRPRVADNGDVPQKEKRGDGLKNKDLVGIPWRVAFALQADGWWLRSDIIWAKPNPMPESVTDRCTRAHEYLFLLAKSERYVYDAAAIAEPAVYGDHPRNGVAGRAPEQAPGQAVQTGIDARRRHGTDKQRGHGRRHAGFNARWDAMTKAEQSTGLRNKRDVWTIPTEPYSGAHFATFPRALVEPCVKAGSRPGDTVLDPFAGSGTTLCVALDHQRNAIGCELSPEYVALARKRIVAHAGLLAVELEPARPAPDTGPTRGDGVIVSSVPVEGGKPSTMPTNPMGAPTSGAGTLSEGAPHA